MKVQYLLLLCSFVLFFGSCKNATTPDTATIEQLFPMSVGNSWTYHSQSFNQDGSISKDTTLAWLTITGTQQYQGHLAYITAFGGGSDQSLLFYSGSDLMQVSSSSPSSAPQSILHYPMNSGSTFTFRDTTYPDGRVDRSLLVLRGKNENVTVPAGSFSCYHFETLDVYGMPSSLDTGYSEDLYFASNVGWIQGKSYSRNNGVRYLGSMQSLKSYVVK